MGEISVWVKGQEKRLAGVSKLTTAAEVTYLFLTNYLGVTEKSYNLSGKRYALFENWRGCYRIIAPRKRVQKLWKLWGREQKYVKFVLKKVAMETLYSKGFGGYVDMERLSTIKVPRRIIAIKTKPHCVPSEVSTYLDNISDTTESEVEDNGELRILPDEEAKTCKISPAEEKKVKLVRRVRTQSERIERLTETIDVLDEEILFYEARLHHNRLCENGVNYVQEAYLPSCDVTNCTKGHNAKGHAPHIENANGQEEEGTHYWNQFTEGTESASKCMVTKFEQFSGKSEIHERLGSTLSGNNNTHHCLCRNRKKHEQCKILVVNPLPREEKYDSDEEEVSVPLKQKPCAFQKPSHSGNNLKSHVGGGKPWLPHPDGNAPISKTEAWKDIIQNELKRLENIESLSFLDNSSIRAMSEDELSEVMSNRSTNSRKNKRLTAPPKTKSLRSKLGDVMNNLQKMGVAHHCDKKEKDTTKFERVETTCKTNYRDKKSRFLKKRPSFDLAVGNMGNSNCSFSVADVVDDVISEEQPVQTIHNQDVKVTKSSDGSKSPTTTPETAFTTELFDNHSTVILDQPIQTTAKILNHNVSQSDPSDDKGQRSQSVARVRNTQISVEAKSSPVTLRKVPKPPIYYPTDVSCPRPEIQDSQPTSNRFLFKRSFSNPNDSFTRNSNVGVNRTINPFPRPVPAKILITPCNQQSNLVVTHSNRKSNINNPIDNPSTVQRSGTIASRSTKHSTPIPIPSKGSLTEIAPSASPDLGLGAEIIFPVTKPSSQKRVHFENDESSSDTGLSSLHSHESSDCSLSVIVETLV